MTDTTTLASRIATTAQGETPDAIGRALASHFEWNGIEIMECFEAALEDANFHAQANEVRGWLTPRPTR